MSHQRVLVTAASRHGSTTEIAEAVGQALGARGHPRVRTATGRRVIGGRLRRFRDWATIDARAFGIADDLAADVQRSGTR